MSTTRRVMALVVALSCPALLVQAQNVPKDWWVGVEIGIVLAFHNNRSDEAFAKALPLLVVPRMAKMNKAKEANDRATIRALATFNILEARLARQFVSDKRIALDKMNVELIDVIERTGIENLLNAGGTAEDFAKDAAVFREVLKDEPDLVLRPEFATLQREK